MSNDQEEKEVNELEKEFLEVQEEALEKINNKLQEASSALAEAEKISEEYGIPFYSYISPISQKYTPASFQEKFGDLESEFLWNVEGAPGEYEGWEHSAAC